MSTAASYSKEERETTYGAVDATIHGEESENAAEKPAKARAPASSEERMAGSVE
jgi:hypothetical protein